MRRDPEQIADELLADRDRILLCGPSGNGKSTLADAVAKSCTDDSRNSVSLLDADPGSPAVGPPGAAALAQWDGDSWRLDALAGIATLDAGRFRLPLAAAVERLARTVRGPLVVDAPGLDRGIPATELIPALVQLAQVDTALVVGRESEQEELAGALRCTDAELRFVEPSDAASAPDLDQKARDRTAAWDDYLAGGGVATLSLGELELSGAHPPLDVRDAWSGRQVALLDADGDTVALGEVRSIEPDGIAVRSPTDAVDRVTSMVARDARRNEQEVLRTDRDERSGPETARRKASPFTLREPPNLRAGIGGTLTVRAGMFRAIFVGGFFDDPTILLDHVQERRALLLDLGEVQRYPVRVLNRVTDVLVTHAHTDHFAGFVRLIRTRVHDNRRCRVFGPRGLARRVESLVDGFTWDRLGPDDGPVFEVCELHGDRLRRWEIRAAGAPRELEARDAPDGLLFREPRFEVRARELDHGTPVLAFAVEEAENYAVRSDRLSPPYEPGPWLGELKRLYAERQFDSEIELPDGTRESVESLADRLLIERPGEAIVYATDFADTPENRRRVTELARDAEVFVCEAFYADGEAEEAEAYGHLTTSSCAELAREADVDRLIPFHFSNRYADQPERLYSEILEEFDRVEVPEAVARTFDPD